MHRDSHLLTLFRAALTGDALALDAFCDAVEENTHTLAPFAREVACATERMPRLARCTNPPLPSGGSFDHGGASLRDSPLVGDVDRQIHAHDHGRA